MDGECFRPDLEIPEIEEQEEGVGKGAAEHHAHGKWIQLFPHDPGATDFKDREANEKSCQNTAQAKLHHLGRPQDESDGMEPEAGEKLPEDGGGHGTSCRESHRSTHGIDKIDGGDERFSLE